jgi:GTP diphosphokinase / guanosine-3',5'-bis(diphosphate) 3'-diphosphatase
VDELKRTLKDKLQRFEEPDRKRILEAIEWGEALHLGQERASGRPYFTHPLEVAIILAEMRLDADAVIAGLLHDVLEDTEISRAEIERRFGPSVGVLVDGVTKISGLRTGNKTVQEAETIRKMFVAMTEDIRVILIKLADKLHNMRTLQHLKEERQKEIAQECLDIFAPLAERLGMSWVKCELQDLSLKTLHRDAYDQIKAIVSQRRDERRAFLARIKADIEGAARKAGVKASINARAKHFYSIYEKMKRRGKSAEELYDLLGIRIICEERDDCYTVLGIVHQLWKPIDGRFKDYIAMPKANGYQSLHTTVMSYEGRVLEVQIRTRAMHGVAEHGVASHWLYKRRPGSRPADLPIIDRLRSWKDMRFTSGEFLEEIKREILKDSIVVFTPKGDAIQLPAGSTPIDFAYHVHTDVGQHCHAAKANGSIVPLDEELRNTQIIEVLTSPQAHPHINWLRSVKTAKARGKIRQWLLQNDQALAIDRYIVAKKKPGPEKPAEARRAAEASQPPGDSEPIVSEVRDTRITGEPSGKKLGISASGDRNLMIRIAGCCHPAPGDPIIGYVSRGRGIIVHRRACRNVEKIPDFAERLIDVEWETAASSVVRRFRVVARRSSDLFSEIEGAVRKYKGHLVEGKLKEMGPGRLAGSFTMELEDNEDWKRIVKSIQGIPSVISIQAF